MGPVPQASALLWEAHDPKDEKLLYEDENLGLGNLSCPSITVWTQLQCPAWDRSAKLPELSGLVLNKGRSSTVTACPAHHISPSFSWHYVFTSSSCRQHIYLALNISWQ